MPRQVAARSDAQSDPEAAIPVCDEPSRDLRHQRNVGTSANSFLALHNLRKSVFALYSLGLILFLAIHRIAETEHQNVQVKNGVL
jgi:hypothetical protein